MFHSNSFKWVLQRSSHSQPLLSEFMKSLSNLQPAWNSSSLINHVKKAGDALNVTITCQARKPWRVTGVVWFCSTVRETIYPEVVELAYICHLLYNSPSCSLKANLCFAPLAFLPPPPYPRSLARSLCEMIGVICPGPLSHGWLITPSLCPPI